ncbi:hypothetical protein IEQ34_010948 [Dendrobium chrysotoxum]|uniref:Pentatricopeptide repeat-containing protein n=1 Tax=Dendrobium chrysotoxum TaxID=161865 RepID=A0AAV7GW24_DENCH|nr:hypothetical protein IEQ34_010948 [Dendrobium chrysotoxum]
MPQLQPAGEPNPTEGSEGKEKFSDTRFTVENVFVGNPPENFEIRWKILICDFPVRKVAERNTVSYNSMIFGLGQNGYFDKAVRLSIEMKSLYVEVDPATFVALMNSCLGREWVVYGDAVKHGPGSDLMIRNALLSCLIKKGSAEEALGFFQKR